MATVIITKAPEGVTLDMYDAVNAHMARENPDPPEGALFHSAAMVDGRLQIVELWESKEAHARFREERLQPAIQVVGGEMGGPADAEPEITAYEAHAFMAAPKLAELTAAAS